MRLQLDVLIASRSLLTCDLPSCPNCRALTPWEGLQSAKPNFVAIEMLRRNSQPVAGSGGDKTSFCIECRKPAAIYCQQCAHFYCADDFDATHRGVVASAHTKQSLAVARRALSAVCNEHRKTIDLTCLKCQVNAVIWLLALKRLRLRRSTFAIVAAITAPTRATRPLCSSPLRTRTEPKSVRPPMLRTISS